MLTVVFLVVDFIRVNGIQKACILTIKSNVSIVSYSLFFSLDTTKLSAFLVLFCHVVLMLFFLNIF